MQGTIAVFRAEAYRLLRSRMVAVSLLLVGAVAALRVLAAHAAARAAHAAAIQRALARGAEPPGTFQTANAYAPFVDGWLAGLTLGTLLLIVLAARTVAGDRESGILRIARTRSAARGALVVGRAILGVPLCLGVIVVTGLAAWVTARELFVFGPLVEHGYQILSEEEMRSELWQAVAATAPPLLATWTFGLAISAIGRSSTLAVGGALAVLMGFDLFKEVLGDRQYWVFAAFSPSFVDGSCMQEMTGIARGLSDAGYTAELYAMNLVLPWPQALALVLVACWATSRRSL